jgi:hypothetical protein
MKHEYSADEIFELSVDSKAVFPLNLEFEIKDKKCTDFCGPGMFFMYFKDELLYIGYFHSSKQDNDVRSQRWRKELATITMRGKWITVNPKADKALDNSTHLTQAPRRPKGDFLTSKKRVEFADKNWNSLNSNYFLCDFIFYWFPEEKGLNRTKKQLKAVTNQLREFYKPTCNG